MTQRITTRGALIDMAPGQFRACAHALVDALADFRDALPEHHVGHGKSPTDVRAALGAAPRRSRRRGATRESCSPRPSLSSSTT